MRKFCLLAALVIAGCGHEDSQPGVAGNSPAAGKPAANQGTQIHLTLHKVIDTDGTGKLASTYLLPEGFTA